MTKKPQKYLVAILMLTVLLISGACSTLSQVKAAATNSANPSAQMSNLTNNNGPLTNNATSSTATSPTALPPNPWPGDTIKRTSPTNAVLVSPSTLSDGNQSLAGQVQAFLAMFPLKKINTPGIKKSFGINHLMWRETGKIIHRTIRYR